jgi:hypothetical protein
MLRRREVINGLALGAAVSAISGRAAGEPAVAQTSSQGSDRALEDVVKALNGVRDEIAHQTSFWEIVQVRDQVRAFLRANGKFPDFIEVGTDVWQQVYDWHVRFQQPITLSRTPDGRHAIALMATVVVMRPDLTGSYVGVPYDNR